MKKYILFLFSGMIIFASCKKDYLTTSAPSEPIDLSKPISFSASVVPIFTANCLGSGCHSVGQNSPTLTADKAYASLINGNYVDPIDTIALNSKLYQRMIGTAKPMPPVGKLPSSKLSAVELWIQQGSQNN